MDKNTAAEALFDQEKCIYHALRKSYGYEYAQSFQFFDKVTNSLLERHFARRVKIEKFHLSEKAWAGALHHCLRRLSLVTHDTPFGQ